MELPYKVTCIKCKGDFWASNTWTKICRNCKNFANGKISYPKLFYKNRKISLERDGRQCQCCGCVANGMKTNQIITHHLDCNPGNNSPSNLITLCNQCHQSLHSKFGRYILRRSNIYKLFAEEKRFGEFGKNLIYGPAKKIVKKQFTGKKRRFFIRK